MLVPLFAALVLAQAGGPVWPGAPIQDAFEHGQRLAASRNGIAEVGKGWRQPAGLWFDGIAKRHSQWAWLLTPECASEWLGYQTGRELRTAEEALRLWTEWSRAHEGELVVVLLLTAFPKLTPVTREAETRADRWGLEKLTASLALDGSTCPLKEARLVERLSGDNERVASDYPFGLAASLYFDEPDRPGFHQAYVPRGPYFAAAWLLRFDVRSAPADWREAKLSFVSRAVRTDVVFSKTEGKPTERPNPARY
ncbi:MAG: hypothetical protein AMXMBFR61_03910 [Fimbriimonadales bacterium]